MPVYKVYAYKYSRLVKEIKADNKDEALRLADELSEDKFTEVNPPIFELDSITEDE